MLVPPEINFSGNCCARKLQFLTFSMPGYIFGLGEQHNAIHFCKCSQNRQCRCSGQPLGFTSKLPMLEVRNAINLSRNASASGGRRRPIRLPLPLGHLSDLVEVSFSSSHLKCSLSSRFASPKYTRFSVPTISH